MPLAGKTLAASFAKELGLPVISMGDKIREIEEGDASKLIFEIREKYGRDYIARICGEELKKLNKDAVIEGIRNIEEIEYLKKIGEVYLIAIHASPATRFKRALDRKRKDDPKNYEEFKERDERELKLGLGSTIALSDYMIVNEESKEELRKNFIEVLKKILNARNRS